MRNRLSKDPSIGPIYLILGVSLSILIGLIAYSLMKVRSGELDQIKNANTLVSLRNAYSEQLTAMTETNGTVSAGELSPACLRSGAILIDSKESFVPDQVMYEMYQHFGVSSLYQVRNQIERAPAPSVSVLSLLLPVDVLAKTPNKAGSVVLVDWSMALSGSYVREDLLGNTYGSSVARAYTVLIDLSLIDKSRRQSRVHLARFQGTPPKRTEVGQKVDDIYGLPPYGAIEQYLRNLPHCAE